MATTFGLKHYWAPTPKRMRQLGDALFGTFGSAGIGASVADYKWVGISFYALAMIGKFLSNLYKDESSFPNTPQD